MLAVCSCDNLDGEKTLRAVVDYVLLLLKFSVQLSQARCQCLCSVNFVDLASFAQRSFDDITVIVVELISSHIK